MNSVEKTYVRKYNSIFMNFNEITKTFLVDTNLANNVYINVLI